jgi:hypothetical protein
MGAIDLAEMLRKLLDVKINKCRKEMLDTYMQIEVERIQAQIWRINGSKQEYRIS